MVVGTTNQLFKKKATRSSRNRSSSLSLLKLLGIFSWAVLLAGMVPRVGAAIVGSTPTPLSYEMQEGRVYIDHPIPEEVEHLVRYINGSTRGFCIKNETHLYMTSDESRCVQQLAGNWTMLGLLAWRPVCTYSSESEACVWTVDTAFKLYPDNCVAVRAFVYKAIGEGNALALFCDIYAPMEETPAPSPALQETPAPSQALQETLAPSQALQETPAPSQAQEGASYGEEPEETVRDSGDEARSQLRSSKWWLLLCIFAFW